MKKTITALTLLVPIMALSACSSTTGEPQVLIKTEFRAVVPPKSLYNCPEVKLSDLPDLDILTNQQISELLTAWYQYNKQCKNSLNAIEKYVAAAKKRLEQT